MFKYTFTPITIMWRLALIPLRMRCCDSVHACVPNGSTVHCMASACRQMCTDSQGDLLHEDQIALKGSLAGSKAAPCGQGLQAGTSLVFDLLFLFIFTICQLKGLLDSAQAACFFFFFKYLKWCHSQACLPG